MRILPLLIAGLLLAPLAVAHVAAPPRSDFTRLLHDCNDDYFGGDSAIGGRDGYDIHTLEVKEAWNSALGHHLVFRTILNGEGPSTITLSMKAGSATKSYEWSTGGSSWTGTFDRVEKKDDVDDGDRFALEGAVKRSTLGASVGQKLTDYTLQGSDGGDDHDSVPGNDNSLGACQDNFRRPDYALQGPVQYLDASFDEESVSVKAGSETFVSLEYRNALRDAAQRLTIELDAGGAISLHDPDTNTYVDSKTLDLNKRGSGGDGGFIHVAVRGDTPSEGVATATLTTSLGGREVVELPYTITAGDAPTPTAAPTQPEPSATPDEESPGLPLLATVALLALVALRRR